MTYKFILGTTQQTGYWALTCIIRLHSYLLTNQQPETEVLLNAQHPVCKPLYTISIPLRKEIKISRSDLIIKCDQYLNGIIGKADLENYAAALILEDTFEWEDDVISDILFQWDNQAINFPITETNIRLWKQKLETDEDLLCDFNQWEVHIDRQKQICEKYKSQWNPINKNLIIGCGPDLNADPVHGLRHPMENGTSGWYIWTGEYSQSDDFFKPICAEHLLQIRPQLIKYFGLEVGFRFLIDKKGYEDVWYDEKVKNI